MATGAGLLGVCLALEAAVGAPVFVPAERFTLAWTHSIEKQRWEEDYAVVADDDGRPLLRLEQARVRGSGAGMEPGVDAVRQDGWYRWRPDLPPLDAALRLTRSPHTGDYALCRDGRCGPLGDVLPSDGGVTLMQACRAPGAG